MTQYKGDFPFPVLFPPGSPKNVLAEALANEKIKQYHCAGFYCFVIGFCPSITIKIVAVTLKGNLLKIDK